MNSAPAIERFLEEVEITKSCWLWKGTTNIRGYGRINVDSKEWLAHRLAWKLFNGDFDESLFVCHICDVPGCVKPSHLFLGTALQNTQDAMRKGRMGGKKGSRNGAAKLTEAQVVNIKTIYAKGGLSAHSIANMFGVHPTTIHDIVKGNRWKHVIVEESING